jgi:predicted DNA-binding ArsR family transcriptional regulator
MRGTISEASWRKALKATRKRELEAAERAKAYGVQVTIATEYTEMADRAERERLADEAVECESHRIKRCAKTDVQITLGVTRKLGLDQPHIPVLQMDFRTQML